MERNLKFLNTITVEEFKAKHNVWSVYNLLTGANKSSYIDNFLDRSINASQLSEGINRALHGDSEYKWFLE